MAGCPREAAGTIIQEHVDRLAVVSAYHDIRTIDPIHIGDGHVLRIGGDSVVRWRLESAIAVAQQDRYRIIGWVERNQIQPRVAVEICHLHHHRPVREGVSHGLRERAVAIALEVQYLAQLLRRHDPNLGCRRH